MWNNNDKILEIYDNSIGRKCTFPYICPVCNNHSGHIYFHKHDDKHCGIWVWCSECGAYSHMSDAAPVWWRNPDFIDENMLCSVPEYLDHNSPQIDNYINNSTPAEDIKPVKDFVMVDKFDVILKEDINGIPAGTKGIIAIRDNFKAMTVEFIDTEGNVINISVPAEKLMQMVDVL